MTKPILVIGATGKTGRRVAERLTAKGIPVKAASRNGQTRFEWNDKSTWLPALEGAGAAYITYFPDLSFPGAAETVEDFAKLAVANGVKRLVLLSGRSEEEAQLAEAAAALSEATGRPLQYIPVTAAEYAEDLVANGLPAEVATPVAGLFAEVLDGRNSCLTDGVERALGRKPHDFADWARETAATGVWDRVDVA